MTVLGKPKLGDISSEVMICPTLSERRSLKLILQNHFNDFICPLWFLSIANFLFILIGHELTTSTPLLGIGLSAGLIWEYAAPFLNPASVSDPIDMICYLLGTYLYYFLLRYVIMKDKEPSE